MKRKLQINTLLILLVSTICQMAISQATTFLYTGAAQTYTVPPGVTSVQIEVWGAQGQAITDEQYDESTGGPGGYAIGELTVTPGEILNVYVGGTGTEAVAGWNGGALGGFGVASDGDPGRGGSGGGASDVRQGGTALGNRVIVGGGGGGGGRDYVNGWCQPCGTGGNGGIGGGLIGGDGFDPYFDLGMFGLNPGARGRGGTQIAGGAGGDGPEGPDGNPGALGVGAIGVDGNFSVGSGGGGGGYYGGGSGAGANWGSGVAAGGGAGGSSYIGGVTSGSTTPGIRYGNGEVVITVLCTGLTLAPVDDVICIGEEITLDATSIGGGTITWDGGVVDAVPFTPSTVGIITYTATSSDPADCGFTIDIEVLDTPEVTITVDAVEICDGETVTFTEGGTADTYVWDPVDIVSGDPYTPIGVGIGIYTLTGTITATGCTNSETIEVAVNELPTVTAAVDFDEICLGESVIFNGGGADSYAWDVPGVTDGIAYEPLTVGTVTYTVTGTDASTGCENTASVDVTVNDSPIVTANADAAVVCEGEMVTLTGGGATTYIWDGGVTDGIAFAPPLGTTTYTVIGTTVSGCENTASIDITVNALPVVVANADDDNVCEGDEVTLTGSGADTYVWDGGVTDGTAFTPPSGTTTYTVIGTSAEGCDGTATIDIVVEPAPTVVATADATEICEGESVTFSGTGTDSYTWDGGVVNDVPFTPASDGMFDFTVTGTDATSGCTGTSTISITVHPTPVVGATASSTEVCLGESFTLNGTGALTYTWTGGVLNGVAFTPVSLGGTTYTVTGTSEYGCTATASINITVIDCEPVVPDFEMKSRACVGDCIKIMDTSTGVVASWEWDFGGTADPATSTEQHPTICLTTAGTYTVELTTTSSTGTVSSVSNNITVYDNPTMTALLDTIVDVGKPAFLVGATASTGTFNWSPSKDVDCPTCQSTTAAPEESTNYTVTLVDNNGCRAVDSVMVLVNFVEGVGVPTAFSPNGDGNNDVLYVRGYALAAVYFAVYNRYGEVVFETSEQNIGWDGKFRGRDENPGVYTWVLQYEFLNGKSGKQKGNTTLIR